MNTNTLRRAALPLSLLLLASSACITGEIPIGEDEQLLVLEPPEEDEDAACRSFCTIAASKGCPPTDDCLEVCAAERTAAPACQAELDAVLGCAAHQMLPELCWVRLEKRDEAPLDEPGTEAWHACIAAIDAYGTCTYGDHDGTSRHLWEACGLDGAGIMWSDTPEGAIDAFAIECQLPHQLDIELDVSCAAGGICSCIVEGEVAHICQNVLHDGHLTMPGAGCCGRYFADLTARP